MKKPLLILIIVLVGILLALWSPWLNWNINIAGIVGVKKPDKISGLQVYSLSGEVEVFVDGVSGGKVDVDKSPLIVDRVQPGDRLVTVKRVSKVEGAYATFSKLITFAENTDTVVSLNLGPKEQFSEWHIITPEKKTDTSKPTSLEVNSDIKDMTILLDGTSLELTDKEASYPISLDKQHSVKISKPGYEEQDFTILPDTQSDRDLLKDYNIKIDAHLMLQPVTVE